MPRWSIVTIQCSTLIAAEETGRVCVGVELDPGYVDAAIRRWQKRTGKDAVHAVTGETFDAIYERAAAADDATSADIPASEPPTAIFAGDGMTSVNSVGIVVTPMESGDV